jgi:hypothetical protein
MSNVIFLSNEKFVLEKAILTILDIGTQFHQKNRIIDRKEIEELFSKAQKCEYQDNEMFGRLTLYGISDNQNIIHNILFRQKYDDWYE